MNTHLGPYQLNTVVTGDARLLSESIPDESIDLVSGDPVYDNIADYAWLSETAARILKPNSACLVWTAIANLPQVLPALQSHLTYRWLFASILPRGKHGMFAQEKMFSNWRCLVWMEKGKSKPVNYFSDVSVESDTSYDGLPRWGKSVVSSRFWLNAFARPGDVVFDPFCGGGTTAVVAKCLEIDYLCFEIDPDTADLARRRLANVQPPLPIFSAEQAVLL